MQGGESEEAWVARVSEELIEQVVKVCPWMGERDVEMLRAAVVTRFGLVVGVVGDLGMMAEHLWELAERAERAGDRWARWSFKHWYNWMRAVMVGEEYQQPEMLEELAALP